MAVLLLAMVFTGCLGGSDDFPDPVDAGDASMLPPGLVLEGADVVSDNDTVIVFSFEGNTQQGSVASAMIPGEFELVDATRTRLHLPNGPIYRVLYELDWITEDRLVLEIRDPTDQIRCLSNVDTSRFKPVACGFPHLTGPEEVGAWTLTIFAIPDGPGGTSAQQAVPFTLTVTVESIAPPSPNGDGFHAVIGFEDSGINPYHEVFRDDSPEAYGHPSTYLSGYPVDAIALNLTLDAGSFDEALEADRAVWESVERGRLYWIPGTKIVGALALQTTPSGQSAGDIPCYPILDCQGHGTRTISRAAGTDTSLCAGCRLAVISDGPVGTPWLASAPWVDVIVDEFVDEYAFDRTQYEEIAEARPLVAPTMNSALPAFRYNFHTPALISVGGHDNGNPAAFAGTFPHVAADACAPTALHHSLDRIEQGAGTSFAAPYVAGAVGELILEARKILDDETVGIHAGSVASGSTTTDAHGPLEDHELGLDELKRILFSTAAPSPEPSRHDGDPCFGLPDSPTPSLVEPLPAYPFIGYGVVNEHTLEHAKRVLRGEEPMPDRPVEDAFFALDQGVRETLVENNP